MKKINFNHYLNKKNSLYYFKIKKIKIKKIEYEE